MYPVLAHVDQLGIGQTDAANALQTAGGTKYPLQFDVMPGTSVQDESGVAWIKKMGFKKVGILSSSEALSVGETQTMEPALRAAGIPYAFAEFPTTSVDVTPELSQLRSAGADVVFALALGPETAYVLNGRAKLNWNVPVLGNLAFAAAPITKLVKTPSEVANVYLITVRDEPASASYPGLATFRQYYAKYNDGTIQTSGINDITEPWDALLAVAAAADKAKSTNQQAIAAALQSLRQTSMPYATLAEVGYSSQDHQNVAATPADFPVIPAGPIVGGQIASK